jgi:hypothetical protein
MNKGRRLKLAVTVVGMVAALALVATGLASCGSTTQKKQAANTGAKLPPGVSEDQAANSAPAITAPRSDGQAAATAPEQPAANTPSASADLYGGRFTVVNATRPDSNKSVISSSQREIKGDYLEAEFDIKNIATDHLVDLSEYSFRLKGPGIAAGTYADYYGNVGTYGAYVADDEISASLLDYSTLQPVAYKVKVGEDVTKVFVFFDLNPENVGRNPNVTKDNTTLVIHKVSGTDYGEEVSIPLTGYPD